VLRELDRNEVEAGVWIAALAGGALFLSDDLRVLPEERASWGLDDRRIQQALGGVVARPKDLFVVDPPSELVPIFFQNDDVALPTSWHLSDGSQVLIDIDARSAQRQP
jgi:hypothetical protein